MLRVKQMNTPKTLAKIGSVYIEEAILAVLEGEEGKISQTYLTGEQK